jgi:hypothetical protein
MKTIKRSDSGQEVRFLQERLSARGFHVAVDGNFGPATETAVCMFQASEQLRPDGIVGAQTWARLLSGSPIPPPDDLLATERKELLARIPGDAAPAVRAALSAAVEALGAREVPDGGNQGPDLDRFVGGYNEYWKIASRTAPPWCACFVSTCIGIGLGLGHSSRLMDWSRHPFGAFYGAAAQIEEWGQKHGRHAAARSTMPAPAGTLFTVSRLGSGSDAGAATAGHVGFIIYDEGSRVVTVEGNVSNQVGSRIRDKQSLRALIMWW